MTRLAAAPPVFSASFRLSAPLLSMPLLSIMALLAGCASGHRDPSDLAANAECRQLADRAYNVQHRTDLMQSDQTQYTPFSSSKVPDDTTSGLAARHQYENQVAACEQGSKANINPPNTVPQLQLVPPDGVTPDGVPPNGISPNGGPRNGAPPAPQ